MSYQVLARKWRPRVFEDVVGQAHVVRALANALETQRLHHAFLFTGTRGVGKTTLARILARCLNCEPGVTAHPCGVCGACREIDEGRFVDLIEVDAASRTKVEDTRDLLENVPYAPSRGRFKVYLIDEVHMLSAHSFNALLKTLEEPPPHVKFLLATTDPQRLPVTVLSRCLQFNLKRLSPSRIAEHLSRVASAEGVPADPGALAALAVAADGSVRDALSLLDQAIAFGAGELREPQVREMLGTLDRGAVFGLLEALARGDAREVLRRVTELADATPDLDGVLAELASVLHRVTLLQLVGEGDEESPDLARLRELAEAITPEDVQLYYQFALLGRRDLPFAPDPRTALEMTLLRMLAFRPTGDALATPALTPTASASARAEPRPPAPAASAAPASGGSADWLVIVDRLGLTGITRELAVNSVLVAHDGDTLTLRLDPAHAQMRSPTREGQLEQTLGQYFGRAVRLVLEVGGPGGGESPAQVGRRQAAEKREGAARVLERDPTVQRLRDVFGATVVEESVRAEEEPDGGHH